MSTAEEVKETQSSAYDNKPAANIAKEKLVLYDDRPSAVFLDLDGTLWDREKVPQSAWDAIEKARSNGHLIFVNTGRTPDSIPDFLWEAGLDGYCLATGMSLFRPGRKLLSQHYIDPKAAKAMEDYLKSQYSGYALEKNDIAFDDPKYAFRRMILFEKEGIKESMTRASISRMTKEDEKELVKLIFDSEKTFELEQKAAELGFDVLIYKNFFNAEGAGSGVFRGELTDARRNKARAMEDILQALGYDHGEYRKIAIGDSENDLPMLEEADVGVAMGNGTIPVLAAADLITAPIHEDGLYQAFERLGLFEKNGKK